MIAQTHSGIFHGDDVLAAATLSFCGYAIRRGAGDVPADVRFDVGGGGGEFDHHGPAPPRRANGVPYAAFGLVWSQFGRMVVEKLTLEHLDDLQVVEVVNRVDRRLCQQIDSHDNGELVHRTARCGDVDIPEMTLASVISGMNAPTPCGDFQDARFQHARRFAAGVLERTVHAAVQEVLEAPVVKEAFSKAAGQIMVLPRFVRWQQHLHGLDPQGRKVLIVVHPGSRGDWGVTVVPTTPGSFESWVKLPAPWAGLVAGEAGKVTGVPGCRFVHAKRFFASCVDERSARELADRALALTTDL